MLLAPVREAHIAKLMGASASNVVASFVLFNEHAATRTSFPIFEVVLEVLVTGPFMLLQHAFRAKFSITKATFEGLLPIDDSLAMFSWAEFQEGIADCLLPQFELFVFVFVLLREILKG